MSICMKNKYIMYYLNPWSKMSFGGDKMSTANYIQKIPSFYEITWTLQYIPECETNRMNTGNLINQKVHDKM